MQHQLRASASNRFAVTSLPRVKNFSGSLTKLLPDWAYLKQFRVTEPSLRSLVFIWSSFKFQSFMSSFFSLYTRTVFDMYWQLHLTFFTCFATTNFPTTLRSGGQFCNLTGITDEVKHNASLFPARCGLCIIVDVRVTAPSSLGWS